MATEYKITYTYKGQGNTGGARSVSLSRFKKTGDVNRKIGQIKSITYEHWHSSTKPMSWGLRGRLVLADDTEFISDRVTKNISGNIVKFTNTFVDLPTPEQWAQVNKIQTLDNNGSTGDSGYSAKLYWRANSEHPMKIIVTFIEEPPVVYAPKVDELDVVRCNDEYKPDDEGTRAKVSLRISLGDTSGLDKAQLRLYYAPNAYPVVGESEYKDLTSRIPELLNGVTDDTGIFNGIEFSAGATWYYAAVFIVGEENDVLVDDMPRALSNLHISGKPNGGVCVCGYSQGTEAEPKFESYAPGYFYNGIHGVTNYVQGEVDTGGIWMFDPNQPEDEKQKIYRYVYVGESSISGGDERLITLPFKIGNLISASGTMKGPDGSVRPIPYSYYGNSNWTACFYVDGSGTINLQLGSGYRGKQTIIIILEYTKEAGT